VTDDSRRPFVDAPFQFENLRGFERGGADVDGRAFRTQVKTNVSKRYKSRSTAESRCWAVCCCIWSSAGQIDLALNGHAGYGLGCDMGDALVLLHHIQHADAADPALIVRLTAGGGIESVLSR